MEDKLYKEIVDEFNHLYDEYQPFDCEANRLSFREKWLQYVNSKKVSEEDWEDELMRRLDDKKKMK